MRCCTRRSRVPGPTTTYGGDRPGDNLFGNSIVALDARTGKRRWYFQTVHHDLWDYDLPAPPGLLDVTINGATVPVLAQAGKTGYLYLLNRVTGEPVFGIEERPTPRSDVPGEKTSPTQPIPLKPPPLARVSYAPEDLVTAEETNAEHAAFCRTLRDRGGGLYNAGPFTPYGFRAEGKRPRTTLLFPGSIGGANWGGTAEIPRSVGCSSTRWTRAGSAGSKHRRRTRPVERERRRTGARARSAARSRVSGGATLDPTRAATSSGR